MSDEKKDVTVTRSTGQPSSLQRHSSPIEDMERMFEDFFHRRFFAPFWTPRSNFPEFADISTSLDMFEDGNNLVIKAELPGLKKEEINIDFSDNIITISGEKKSEEKTERKDYHRVERTFGSFTRKLRLPVEVQIDKTKASFKDGVLEITMPKSETQKQKVRKVTVD